MAEDNLNQEEVISIIDKLGDLGETGARVSQSASKVKTEQKALVSAVKKAKEVLLGIRNTIKQREQVHQGEVSKLQKLLRTLKLSADAATRTQIDKLNSILKTLNEEPTSAEVAGAISELNGALSGRGMSTGREAAQDSSSVVANRATSPTTKEKGEGVVKKSSSGKDTDTDTDTDDEDVSAGNPSQVTIQKQSKGFMRRIAEAVGLAEDKEDDNLKPVTLTEEDSNTEKAAARLAEVRKQTNERQKRQIGGSRRRPKRKSKRKSKRKYSGGSSKLTPSAIPKNNWISGPDYGSMYSTISDNVNNIPCSTSSVSSIQADSTMNKFLKTEASNFTPATTTANNVQKGGYVYSSSQSKRKSKASKKSHRLSKKKKLRQSKKSSRSKK